MNTGTESEYVGFQPVHEYRGVDGRWYLDPKEAQATGGICDEHHWAEEYDPDNDD